MDQDAIVLDALQTGIKNGPWPKELTTQVRGEALDKQIARVAQGTDKIPLVIMVSAACTPVYSKEPLFSLAFCA